MKCGYEGLFGLEMEECFAYSKVEGCICLKETRCYGFGEGKKPCPFYKTRKQAKIDEIKYPYNPRYASEEALNQAKKQEIEKNDAKIKALKEKILEIRREKQLSK